MNRLNRRGFLKRTAGVLLGGGLLSSTSGSSPEPTIQAPNHGTHTAPALRSGRKRAEEIKDIAWTPPEFPIGLPSWRNCK